MDIVSDSCRTVWGREDDLADQDWLKVTETMDQ